MIEKVLDMVNAKEKKIIKVQRDRTIKN